MQSIFNILKKQLIIVACLGLAMALNAQEPQEVKSISDREGTNIHNKLVQFMERCPELDRAQIENELLEAKELNRQRGMEVRLKYLKSLSAKRVDARKEASAVNPKHGITRDESGVNPADSMALVEFYFATNGDNWTNNANWLIGPVSTWAGLDVEEIPDEYDLVRGIYFHNNNLVGTIPPEIAYITSLQVLELSWNHLSGSIPWQLINLQELEYLDLFYNNLSGAIPPELGNLTNLQTLYLSWNSLTGGIPYEFGWLESLEWLDVSWCLLSDPIPVEIALLQNLWWLDIHMNDIGGVLPVEMCQMNALAQMVFNDNYFDTQSCPTIMCLLSNGVEFVGGAQQKNGLDLEEACLFFDDWSLPVLTLYNTNEAAIVYRTGDIDNLGFGWPEGFNLFEGAATEVHTYPFEPEPDDPAGTDRIMVISGYNYPKTGTTDDYTSSTSRPWNFPEPIDLEYDLQFTEIEHVVLQFFADDFQAGFFGDNYFQVTINDVRIPIVEEILNSIVQTGPVGRIITVQIPDQFIYLFYDGFASIYIDDPIHDVGDGYTIDFVRLLINPLEFQYTGTVWGYVSDNDGNPVEGAVITASGMIVAISGLDGYYEILNVPAGLVHLSASKEGYNNTFIVVELLAGNEVIQDFILHPALILCEALDNCDLTFLTGGDLPWFSQSIITFDGEDAAQTGGIEDNGQTWLETIVEGPGTLTFYWKVSSEPDFDYLKFYIDGIPVDEISGEVDWHYKEYGIPEGYYAMTWWYTKDGSASAGQDAGWVDQVTYTPSVQPELNLSGEIPPGPGGCFAASQLITVSELTIFDGGSVTLVVGPEGRILLLEGTEVQSGGYLRAWVDPAGNYCNQPEALVAAGSEHETNKLIADNFVKEDFFTVYPNPSSGIFNIEISGNKANTLSVLEIYGLMGNRLLSTESCNQNHRQIDISSLPGGIYLLRVVKGKDVGMVKLLKQ